MDVLIKRSVKIAGIPLCTIWAGLQARSLAILPTCSVANVKQHTLRNSPQRLGRTVVVSTKKASSICFVIKLHFNVRFYSLAYLLKILSLGKLFYGTGWLPGLPFKWDTRLRSKGRIGGGLKLKGMHNRLLMVVVQGPVKAHALSFIHSTSQM
jgi:hypothetical protein